MSDPYASVTTRNGIAQLSNLEPAHVPLITRYWLNSGDAHLDFLGIDRKRLGDEHEIAERFRCAIRSGRSDQPAQGFAITLDGCFVGYTLLNHYDTEINYSHWHVTDVTCRGAGLSTALYPWRIKTYFDCAPIARLIHQTRTRNVAVNRMLDKFVPVAKTMRVEKPDGFALPGEFHVRYVHAADIPRLFQVAVQLRRARK